MRLLEENPTGVGYLLKDRIAHASTLIDALVRVSSGECLVDPSIVARLLARARHHDPLDDLTAAGTGGAGSDGGRTVERRHRP